MKETDYTKTITVFKFIDGTKKTWMDDKYRIEEDPDMGVVIVYSCITGKMVFKAFIRNLAYIQYNVTYRPRTTKYRKDDQETDDTLQYSPDTSDIELED